MDGRGPAQVRAGDPGGAAAGHDRAAGADHGRARPAARGRPRAGVVDPDHAPGLVAPGARRLRLAPAAGRVPALHHRVEPAPPLARAGGARPRPGDPRRLPPPRARPQAAANGGDHRHPEREDRAATRAARLRRRQEGQGRKRVLMVDTEGDPLGVRAVPADVHEHRALPAPAPDLAAHPTLRLIWLDRGFAGDEPEAFLNRHGIVAEVGGIRNRAGFQLEKRRWKAEQTFGCLQRYRRLRVDDEMSCETSRGMTLLTSLFMTGMRLERLVAS